MKKILTTGERIKDPKIFRKCSDVVRNMSVREFERALFVHCAELDKYYNISDWKGHMNSCSPLDFCYGLANLLVDHENISLTRYKRLFG
jgi:hypothetical protein